MLTICYSFLQLWATFAAKLMKRPTFFFFFFSIFWNFHFIFTCLQNCMITKFYKKMLSVSVCEQNPAYSNNCEQYFPQKLWNIIRYLQHIFEVCFNFYTVTQFYYDHIFTAKMTAVSMLLTKCYLFQKACSSPRF